MSDNLSTIRVGDWVWTIKRGWVPVSTVYGDDISVRRGYFSAGRCIFDNKGISGNDKYPSAFIEPPEGFNAEPKPKEEREEV
jgi:hypothetical protein